MEDMRSIENGIEKRLHAEPFVTSWEKERVACSRFFLLRTMAVLLFVE